MPKPEDDLFYPEMGNDLTTASVRKRPEKTDSGVIMGFEVCVCCDLETAKEIARALNRIAEAELLIIRLAQAIRGDDKAELALASDAAEEFIVNG